MSKKKNEKLKNVKIDISDDDAAKIISSVGRKKTALKINVAELVESLNSLLPQALQGRNQL